MRNDVRLERDSASNLPFQGCEACVGEFDTLHSGAPRTKLSFDRDF